MSETPTPEPTREEYERACASLRNHTIGWALVLGPIGILIAWLIKARPMRKKYAAFIAEEEGTKSRG